MILASIRAGKLKHMVSVLQAVDRRAIFHISENGIECRLQNRENSMAARVIIPRAAFISYAVGEPYTRGVDLIQIDTALQNTNDADAIDLIEWDDRIVFEHGTDMWDIATLPVESLPKCPDFPDLPTTIMFEMSGQRLKNIVANASGIGDLFLIAVNDMDAVISAEDEVLRYQTTVRVTEGVPIEVVSMYDMELVQMIAHNMIESDHVILRHAVMYPLTARYVRGQIEVDIMIAPRAVTE